MVIRGRCSIAYPKVVGKGELHPSEWVQEGKPITKARLISMSKLWGSVDCWSGVEGEFGQARGEGKDI